jgi:lysophospholipase L1-like esterase
MCYKVLCYGDSNTYGYDPRSYLGEQYPETVRWTALLEKAGWQVINQGENGRSIPRHDREITAAVGTICRWKPDIVMIMLGSNDLLQAPSLSAENCAERMEQFLYTLLPQCPPCKFLLIAPPPITLGAWVGDSQIVDTSRCLAKYYEVVARRLSIYFADAGMWNVGLAFDGIHFSEAGHLAFAKEIERTLRDIAVKSN